MKIVWLAEIFVALIVGALLWFFLAFPNVAELEKSFPKVIYDKKDKTTSVEIVDKKPSGWVRVNEVSRVALGAIIVSEDWAFYTHDGYDLSQIRESMERNIKLGRFARGGSTITQQVAKNIYLSSEKTLARKLNEFLIAIALERNLNKKRILELYINIAEWGDGIYGLGAASRHYFGLHPSQLSAKQGAFLAMLLPSPKKYSVSHRKGELTRYARKTIIAILRKMLQAGYILPANFSQAYFEPLPFERAPLELPMPAMEDGDPGLEDELDEMSSLSSSVE